MEDEEEGNSCGVEESSTSTVFSNHPPAAEHANSNNGGGTCGAIFNLSNMVLGSGIMAIPYALKLAGLWQGIVILCLVGYITNWTLRHFVLKGVSQRQNTYMGFVRHCFGVPGYVIALIMVFFLDFGSMISYLVVLGDTLTPLVLLILPSCVTSEYANLLQTDDSSNSLPGYCFIANRNVLIVVASFTLLLPICLYRHLRSLAAVSYISICTVGMIIVIVAVQGLTRKIAQEPQQEKDGSEFKFFSSVGIIAFAFVCQDLSFFAYKSLTPPTKSSWNIVAHSACLLSLGVCLVMGICGYISFGDGTKSNILNNFSYDNIPIDITRLGLAITMILTYPLNLFVAREIILDAYTSLQNKRQKKRSLMKTLSDDVHCVDDGRVAASVFNLHPSTTTGPDDNVSQTEIVNPNVSFYTVTMVMFLGSIVISMFAKDLGHVQSIVGGIAGVFIAYLFPTSCLLVTAYREGYEGKSVVDANMSMLALRNLHGNRRFSDPVVLTEDVFDDDDDGSTPVEFQFFSFCWKNLTATLIFSFGVFVLFLSTLENLASAM
eukprot:Nk52_evm44s1401 gene=Nk52_evmTU44s1401